MDPAKRTILSILLFLALIGLGCIGYMTIENWNFMDALYMTIITLATVGYGEVHTLSMQGRLFTLLLILLGVGYFLYLMGYIIQFLVEGRIRLILGRRKLDTQINRLKGHYIICGYGRIGRVLTRYLINKNIDVVIIEQNTDLVAIMNDDHVSYLVGEAMEESLLIKAGIHRAKGLVTAVATDADNVFLVLTARQLAPDLKIIARASQEKVKKKFEAAGADSVESPYEMGAVSMAHRIIRPTVTNFLDLAFEHQRKDIQMEEIPVSELSKLVNVPLKDSGIRQNYNLIIIAIKKSDGDMLFNPSFETVIMPHDTVIAVGESDNLQKLEKVLNP